MEAFPLVLSHLELWPGFSAGHDLCERNTNQHILRKHLRAVCGGISACFVLHVFAEDNSLSRAMTSSGFCLMMPWSRSRCFCKYLNIMTKYINFPEGGAWGSKRDVICMLQPGGCRKHNFWTTRVKLIKIYTFGILALRAIDWYIYGSNRRGGVRGLQSFLDPPPKFYWVTPTKF